jgi:UDP-glucose 4-epimerase
MSILVTGGAGFIGSHLCERLIREGHKVTVIDLKRPESEIAQVEYIQGDVCDTHLLPKLIKDCDTVFHLAAIVSVPLCEENPEESKRVNLGGTLNVVDSLVTHQSRTSLVFFSSAAVYGALGEKVGYLPENSRLTSPPSYYAKHKRDSEIAIQKAHTNNSLSAIILRPFNVYGPKQNPLSPYSGVISRFIHRSQEEASIDIYGNGEQTRDFIHVFDVVEACVKALDKLQQPCFEILNLGTGQAVTINELAKTVSSLVNKKGVIRYEPPRSNDISRSCADISKITRELNWRPNTQLSEGILSVISTKIHDPSHQKENRTSVPTH